MNEKPKKQFANTRDEIRSKNNEMKCAFIKNVISQNAGEFHAIAKKFSK